MTRLKKGLDGNDLLDALQDHRDRKKARVAPPSVYRSVEHVFFTTNNIEHLFSWATIVLSDLRNEFFGRCPLDAVFLAEPLALPRDALCPPLKPKDTTPLDSLRNRRTETTQRLTTAPRANHI